MHLADSSGKQSGVRWWSLTVFIVAVIPGFWQESIRVDVSLVNVFATVQDEAGFVTNLERDDFRVYENDLLREIAIFEGQQDVQSSFALLVDTSGSTVDTLPFMRRGIRDFTRSVSRTDDFLVVSYGTGVQLIHRSLQGQRHLEDSLGQLRPWGTTALFDAMLYGVRAIGGSERPRKALIVFADGNDNASQAPYRRVVEEVQRSGVLMYFIAMDARIFLDAHTLESLSDLSGGRTFYVPKADSVFAVLGQIRSELASQYYLGYYASRRPGYHHIRVEVPGRDVKVRAKTGYID